MWLRNSRVGLFVTIMFLYSTGLAIDSIGHVAYALAVQAAERREGDTGVGFVLRAMREVGTPVAQGVLLSMLGAIPLAFAPRAVSELGWLIAPLYLATFWLSLVFMPAATMLLTRMERRCRDPWRAHVQRGAEVALDHLVSGRVPTTES